jgi:hypothetical protein
MACSSSVIQLRRQRNQETYRFALGFNRPEPPPFIRQQPVEGHPERNDATLRGGEQRKASEYWIRHARPRLGHDSRPVGRFFGSGQPRIAGQFDQRRPVVKAFVLRMIGNLGLMEA